MNTGINAGVVERMLRDDTEWIRVPSNVLIQDAYKYFTSSSHVGFAMINFRGTLFDAFPANYTTPDSEIASERRRFELSGAITAWSDAFTAAQQNGRPNLVPESTLAGDHITTIGIVDTGVDLTNPDLLPNIWINQAEIPEDVHASAYDCDCDGLLTFIDLNWKEYFPGVPCTSCVGVQGSKNPGLFNSPPQNPTDDLNERKEICDKTAHAPFDLCDPGDLVSATNMEEDFNPERVDNLLPVGGLDFDANSFLYSRGASTIMLVVPDSDNLPHFVDVVDRGVDGNGISTTANLTLDAKHTGTSYLAPQVSGAVGLLRSLHPEYTSAISITTLYGAGDPLAAPNDAIHKLKVLGK